MAQQLRGYVHSSDGEALPFATVMLHNADSTFVAGTITGDSGEFVISPVSKRNMLLKVSCLGYSTEYVHPSDSGNTLVYGDRGVDKWNKSDSRQLLFTLRYQLNTAKSKYMGVSAGGTNKNRL